MIILTIKDFGEVKLELDYSNARVFEMSSRKFWR